MNLKSEATKTAGLILLGLALGVAGTYFWLRSPAHEHAQAAAKPKTLYTCGMHPRVIQNKPGNCPICGMKLTPMRKQAGAKTASAGVTPGERKIKFYKSTMIPGEVSPTARKDSMGMDMVPVYEDEAAAAESATIAIDPPTTQNMGIRTTVVTNGPLRRVIRTVGVIDYDETALADVSTKFKGWIEKLYVDAIGKEVHRGEPLFEIYSPDVYSAQTEYLLALGESKAPAGISAENLRTTARLKLKYWDIPDEQIAALEKTRQPRKALRVNAPSNGFVVEKMAVQGQMVEAGMRLYRLADLGLVWVHAQVYEQDLAVVQLGQEAVVSVSYLPDRKFRGRVTYIYPTVDEKTRTAKVRMEFHNPGYFLKPGMFASVELRSEVRPSVVLVPDSAVLRSGEKNTVFVTVDGGRFEPRTVALGLRAENDQYQVLSGLKEGERIVTSGQFMLDSESQLREAIQKMLHPTSPQPMVQHAGTVMPPMGAAATAAAPKPMDKVVYVCPMPEHVSIQYDHSGDCPICGMALVPVSAAALAKLQPGGIVQYYTCPMPEHSGVHLDKPGKCPKCAMTLIPVMEAPKLPTNAAPSPAMPAPALYTCPMASHADVVSDRPGQCPKCEMTLVPTGSVPHGKTAEENWRKQHAADHQH